MVSSASDVPAFPRAYSPRLLAFRQDVDLDGAAEWRKREPVEIEGAKEIDVCRYLWIDIFLSQEVQCEFGVWKKLVPEVNWEVAVGAGKDGNEMRFEVFDGYLCNIPTMSVRWDEFELACFADEFHHAVGALVVEDVLLGDNSCFLDALEEGKIGLLNFGVLAA